MEKTKLDPFISDLLYEHDCVIIADFGGFVANYKSSHLHTAQHTISPPSKKIAFNASLKINDGLLAAYIAENHDLSYQEACNWISRYVEESLNVLDTGKKLQIDRVGSLFYNQEKKIQFAPDSGINYLLDSFGLDTIHSPAISRESPPKKSLVKLPESRLRENQDTHKKSRFSWKWIELVPAAALLTLLYLNPVVVRQLSENVGSLIPVSHTVKPQPEPTKISGSGTDKLPEPPSTNELPADKNLAPSTDAAPGTLSAEPVHQPALTTLSVPGGDGEAAVKNENDSRAVGSHKEITTTHTETTPETFPYYIVAGCFRIEENAKQLHKDLLGKGFASELIGRYKGLHVVTFQHATSLADAKQELEKLKGLSPDAWVLKK